MRSFGLCCHPMSQSNRRLTNKSGLPQGRLQGAMGQGIPAAQDLLNRRAAHNSHRTAAGNAGYARRLSRRWPSWNPSSMD